MVPGRRPRAEYMVSLDGERAAQTSHKVKRKGLLAKGEQLRTEEMKVMTSLVTFEIAVVILILEVTNLRRTKTQ